MAMTLSQADEQQQRSIRRNHAASNGAASWSAQADPEEDEEEEEEEDEEEEEEDEEEEEEDEAAVTTFPATATTAGPVVANGATALTATATTGAVVAQPMTSPHLLSCGAVCCQIVVNGGWCNAQNVSLILNVYINWIPLWPVFKWFFTYIFMYICRHSDKEQPAVTYGTSGWKHSEWGTIYNRGPNGGAWPLCWPGWKRWC